jgi:hypothetical protein
MTMRTPTHLFLAALTATGAAHAQYFEARNSAMGGVGTASSNYLAAGWGNPALLTSCDESDDFGLILPAIGARAYDESGLMEDIDNFVDAYSALDGNPNATPQDYVDLGNRLLSLSGRRLNSELGGGLVLALPSQTFGISLHARSYADLQLFTNIDPNDVNTIAAAPPGGALPALSSEARIVGVGITEIGVSFARRFELAGLAVSVGVTPKYQRVDTYNYAVDADNFDAANFDEDQFRSDEDGFNVDAGVAIEPGVPGLTIGVMARNLSRQTFSTVGTAGAGFDYEITPQVAVGVAWELGALTLAADVDALPLERFDNDDLVAAGQSFVDDIQLLRFGAEFDVFGWLQLRGGYEHDLEDTLNGAISAGLGISPFEVVRLDIAGTYVEGSSYGAVAQLSLTF